MIVSKKLLYKYKLIDWNVCVQIFYLAFWLQLLWTANRNFKGLRAWIQFIQFKENHNSQHELNILDCTNCKANVPESLRSSQTQLRITVRLCVAVLMSHRIEEFIFKHDCICFSQAPAEAGKIGLCVWNRVLYSSPLTVMTWRAEEVDSRTFSEKKLMALFFAVHNERAHEKQFQHKLQQQINNNNNNNRQNELKAQSLTWSWI